MTAEIQLVYTNIATGRIARITDHSPMITPAELEELTWLHINHKMIPTDAYQNPNNWEVTMTGIFKKAPGEVSTETNLRLNALSLRASCLENISWLINVMRFRRTTHVYGWSQLVPMYMAEIKTYRETNIAGPLLSSLSTDINELPISIAEFELVNSDYENFLQSTEVMRNKWINQIKQAEDPTEALNLIKRELGL